MNNKRRKSVRKITTFFNSMQKNENFLKFFLTFYQKTLFK